MKTINDAAKEHAKEVNNECYDEFFPNSNFTVGEICETDFKCGVAFAQQWIPVEEELPESFGNLFLVKYKDVKGNDKYGLAKYFDMSFLRKNKSKSLNFTIQGSCSRNVTHWRPIELI